MVTQFFPYTLRDKTIPFIGDFSAVEVLTVGAVTTPPTKGSVQIDETSIRQVGSEGETRINMYMDGAGVSGSGDYLFSLPNGNKWGAGVGLYTGTSRLAFANDGFTGLRIAFNSDTATLTVVPYDATRYRLLIGPSVDDGGTSGAQTLNWVGSADFPWGSVTNMTIKGKFSAPIEGFNTTKNLSEL